MENRKNQEKRFVHGAAPPLTAVERFLYGQKNDSFGSKKHERSMDQPILKTTGGVEISSYNKENMLFGPRKSFGGNRNPIDDHDKSTNCKEITKKRPYKDLIKGQWTADEDMKLIKLVRQHGERKWAIISEKLEGRAGKQCRERWHNHLRPDIKKDSWSEEEEKVFVEAHTKIGNKWAEIAKLIRGRTENSIKNHWNATKRRQNSKRKHKRSKNAENNSDLDDLSPSSKRPRLLENYIRRIEKNDKDNAESIITTSANSLLSKSSLAQIHSDGDSTSSLLDDPYDEELVFLKNIFSNHSISLENMYLSQITPRSSSSEFMIKNPNPNLHDNSVGTHHGGTMVTTPPNKRPLASDIYLSSLLDGSVSCSSSSDFSSTSSTSTEQGGYTEFLAPQANSTSEKREMDLIEMLSGSTQGSNNIWFPLF